MAEAVGQVSELFVEVYDTGRIVRPIEYSLPSSSVFQSQLLLSQPADMRNLWPSFLPLEPLLVWPAHRLDSISKVIGRAQGDRTGKESSYYSVIRVLLLPYPFYRTVERREKSSPYSKVPTEYWGSGLDCCERPDASLANW